MSARRRVVPSQPFTSHKAFELLERAYDLESDEQDWLTGLLESLRAVVDRGAGLNAWSQPYASLDDPRVTRVELGHDLDAMWRAFSRAVPAETLAELVPELISNADMSASPLVQQHARAGHAAMGVHSYTSLNIRDGAELVLSIGIPAPEPGTVFWPRQPRALWHPLIAHLGAAYRLRRRASTLQAALIMDVRGRVQHLEPQLASAATAESLRQGVLSVLRARSQRSSPQRVLAAWPDLLDGAWSIVESVERDGRRLLRVYLNPADPAPAPAALPAPAHVAARSRPLSPGELRAVREVANGYSNKRIAHELEHSMSTTSSLLLRARRKLGVQSRVELVQAARALLHQDGRDGVPPAASASPAPPPRPETPPLTVAEQQVKKLVLDGLSNKQIAARRRTAQATVAAQLQSIYRKLGITSRSELAIMQRDPELCRHQSDDLDATATDPKDCRHQSDDGD